MLAHFAQMSFAVCGADLFPWELNIIYHMLLCLYDLKKTNGEWGHSVL